MDNILGYILHLDVYLIKLLAYFGLFSYLILFIVIFCETGLVIFPFLPGDSLLFALGSIAAQPESELRVALLFFILIAAAALGNLCNYLVGRWLGPKVFKANSRFLNKKYLLRAHNFYEKSGKKAIILAIFLPIVRSFSPFVAGVGYMKYPLFLTYSLSAALLWVGILLGSGYFFGSLNLVKNNFSVVIYGIIFLSLLPSLWTLIFKKKAPILS